ncbi:MAG: hypothetical protein CVU89_09115 [Firmicutes bacterium HGW-Firmicutes-14]|nr:MAG: hypothetical protein CVU89_09115 [Firmicutes bacterium HGW-Firmicutes-14]
MKRNLAAVRYELLKYKNPPDKLRKVFDKLINYPFRLGPYGSKRFSWKNMLHRQPVHRCTVEPGEVPVRILPGNLNFTILFA